MAKCFRNKGLKSFAVEKRPFRATTVEPCKGDIFSAMGKTHRQEDM